ncbi:hypothetical protein ACCO45_004983 [Purpureocillium lilacinum]|uniref:Uncharacterized protein n=1 Tax=Purpureocillium lilacinum TaxID=33203 RepID=A0ACC4DU45_PURLI
MSCACRTAPWRAFVQGLAQVHRLEAAPILRVTRAAAGLAPVAPARLALRRALPAAPLRGDRGFHASSGLRQDAAGAAAAKTHEPPNTTRETEEGLSAEPPSSEQEASALSPDALAGIRALNAQFPDVYTTQALADKFEVSAEAIRRILKSKWQPSAAEEEERQQRWFRRGVQVWEHKAALGVKPPRRWRREGVARDPAYHERRGQAAERERRWEEEEDRRYRERRGDGAAAAGAAVAAAAALTAGWLVSDVCVR